MTMRSIAMASQSPGIWVLATAGILVHAWLVKTRRFVPMSRVVANIEGVEREALQIGLPVEATFVDYDDELSLPVFGPASSSRAGAA